MSFTRYPSYKDSGVEWLGEIPENWDVRPLGYLCERIGSGKTPLGGSETYTDSGVLFIRSQNVYDDGLRLDDVAYISDGTDSEMMCSRVRAGDILLNITGASIGRTCIVPDSLLAANVNQHVCVIRLFDAPLRRFLSYFLKSSEVKAQIDLGQNGAAREGLNFSQISAIRVATAPVGECDAIAAFLDHETAKIDALMAEQRTLIELLKEKRQAVISHAVTKGLNPDAPMKDSGVEWLGDVPAHWSLTRLKIVSPFITVGIVVNPSEYVSEDGCPFIYGGDIAEGKINFAAARRISDADSQKNGKTLLHEGDLLTVRVGAPGITAVVPKECEGGNCASVMLIRKGNFDSRWLCYAMNSRMIRYQVEIVQYGAAQEQFNISHAINFWVVLPKLEEQIAIATCLDRETANFDALTAEAEKAIALLQERRTALISAAVTGKIDVRGWTR